jgi:hypothetical protein
MGPDILSGIASVLGVMVPVLALSIGGLLLLSRSRIGEAVARRIAGDSHHPECESQIASLQDQVDGLQSQLSDTQERLDFAERLLTRVDESRRGITHGDV